MSTTEQIPFLDLIALHKELEEELLSTLRDTLRVAGFVGGPKVEEFEREFAKFCDASHCVGVASGTDAVRFALTAAGVKPGDIVVTVPHTFIATTEAISQAGGRPILLTSMNARIAWILANLRSTSSVSVPQTRKPAGSSTGTCKRP